MLILSQRLHFGRWLFASTKIDNFHFIFSGFNKFMEVQIKGNQQKHEYEAYFREKALC